ncbi:hypothetical protein ROA7450_03102 [Roseovarius albus]|uniref:eCIS core domain-containing protein n=1 Tax=Roseovarius albus TaxID=1247867 RepID=A0A1X6ZSV5_9RHOB|nr:DUF4157 domain-containing protein [Roseovarius albus]SLN59802.1 hypothetical protein ROA7450_03102 [Roseovarius albus]
MSTSARKTPQTAAKENQGAKRRWSVNVKEPSGVPANSNAAVDSAKPHIGVAELELAVLDSTPLPWRAELERHFETSLAGLLAYQGPEVDAALAEDNAAAAVQGEAILLPLGADKPLVAHEVAHVLQQHGSLTEADADGAELEALQTEQRVAHEGQVPIPQAVLPMDTVALRSNEALDEQLLVQGNDREAASEFSNAAQENSADAEGAATESTEEDTSRSLAEPSGEGVLGDVVAGEPLPEDPVPTFEPPAAPEIEVDEAAAEAAQAEAEAAVEGAEEADGLIEAFKDAPPSVKAMHHDQLDGKVGEMAETDQAEFEEQMPEFPAEMSGTDDLDEPEAVQTPESGEVQLEDGTPGPAPDAQVDPTADPGTPDLNAEISNLLSNFFSFGEAEGLGRTFSRVSTSDNDVDTSAGDRPDVPLQGGTDPQRVDDQDTAARDDAKTKRMEATQAVTEGPGPEQVELKELREDYTMEAREKPVIDQAEAPVEGAAGFRDKELDTEVVALFDAHHGEAMAASMEEANSEVSTAVESRDTERDAELTHAEEERARLNEEADEGQRGEVADRRQEVQDARQHAVDEQQARVDEMETQADLDRQEAESTIDTEVSETETQVEADFGEAETDAQAEVDDGERQAQEERDRQERESENASWWELAANWVAEQFDKLTKFINDVFDAVRSAVKDIIDAVKEAAIALIDAAVSAISAAIEALGEALKAAVNALLAEHFPALAEALNNAIDTAVEVATEVVEAIGEGLKAAVSALLDALAAAIDAILAAYQAAINAALAIARAALTGDWAALAKLVLEPILYALGIEPAAFYQMIERAMEALETIIDDPIGFLSNLVDVVVGGIRQFGGNIIAHLQQGIISWLTGALGGDIQIPERFDLMGVLDLARQILGLTVDMIRRVAVRVLGEEAVERIEFFMGYVVELITGGFSALWERIMSDLSALKDMVLDGIKSFLMERVVMAAITWLASMFNPIGALVKLVMTIWNFLMFLKDQLARIIQVVQTVVNTMWEIATGVLQPAIDGVEGVLGRLLPIVIDLLARLLGLGNVAGKVREIIGDVRQRIEDALVTLINRVLSAFTGGRMGGRSGDSDEDAATSDGEIMAPIAVRGGGESHTLVIQDQGETVVPMIHSTPQTLESWLDSRAGAPYEALAAEKNWRGAVKNNKKAQLEALVARANEEEAQLDRAAEAAEDALNADPATATDEQQNTQTEGEQTKRALVEILEFFGIDTEQSLADHFAEDIDATGNADLKSRLRSNVMNRLDAARYMTLAWPQAKPAIAADAAIPGTWARPASSNAILRSLHDTTFRTGVTRIVEAHIETPDDFELSAQNLDDFLSNYLVADLNQVPNAQTIIRMILDGSDGNAIATSLQTVIEGSADRAFGSLMEFDFKFNDVTGRFYKTQLVPNAGTLMTGTFGKYIEDDAANATGDGGVDKPLTFFLTESKRASKNRTRLADSVRAADPGNHEWIPSSRAASIISATAAQLGSSGDTDPLQGLAKLLKFQHEVRTPTSKLIFKPNADLSNLGRTVPYYSEAHADAGVAFADMTAEQKKLYYPEGGPQHGDQIIVLQAHAGGLDAGKVEGAVKVRSDRLQWASPEWHRKLGEEVDQPIADNIASNSDGTAIKTAILGFYRDTIWRGALPLEATGGRRFDLYFTSTDSQWRSYDSLKSYASAAFTSAETELVSDMDKVF